jgi:hypothetical protein
VIVLGTCAWPWISDPFNDNMHASPMTCSFDRSLNPRQMVTNEGKGEGGSGLLIKSRDGKQERRTGHSKLLLLGVEYLTNYKNCEFLSSRAIGSPRGRVRGINKLATLLHHC